MNTETTIPAAYFENDEFDYDVVQHTCSSCNDDFAEKIYFDHMTNGNICEKCLTAEELPYILGMKGKELEKYQDKVRKQLPIQTN